MQKLSEKTYEEFLFVIFYVALIAGIVAFAVVLAISDPSYRLETLLLVTAVTLPFTTILFVRILLDSPPFGAEQITRLLCVLANLTIFGFLLNVQGSRTPAVPVEMRVDAVGRCSTDNDHTGICAFGKNPAPSPFPDLLPAGAQSSCALKRTAFRTDTATAGRSKIVVHIHKGLFYGIWREHCEVED